MELSELLRKYNLVKNFTIYNEKDFQTFALTQSKVEMENCTFVDDGKFIQYLTDKVKMVLTTETLSKKIMNENRGVCVVDEPRSLFFKLHNSLKDDKRYVRKKFKSKVGGNCIISSLASIATNNVIIGNNVIVEEFVIIRENTFIGDSCIIRSGAKLGGIDFEFKRDENGIFGVEHYGGLVLGNNVEVHCNTVINKALYPWDNTVIGDDTKVDEMVNVAHGVKIGRECMVIANAAIGGRTEIGDNCWIGMSATIRNGISIGNNARVNMGAVVTKAVEPGESVTGNFAIEHGRFIDEMK